MRKILGVPCRAGREFLVVGQFRSCVRAQTDSRESLIAWDTNSDHLFVFKTKVNALEH